MIENILSRLQKVRQSGNSWTARCPAHEDKQPSLSISYGIKGILLNCHAGCTPDAITGAVGLSMRDLFYDASDSPKTPHKAVVIDLPTMGLQPWAKSLWDECKPLSGVALDYLHSRHCVIPPKDGDLRWHDAVKHPSGYIGAALIGLVTHVETNEPMSLHRTWITPTGKADVEPHRMLAGKHSAKNGVIRLFPDDCVTTGLAIAEGIETALSLAHEFEPAWAAISANNMADLPVLDIESLMIAVDTDDAGKRAAQLLGHRWVRAGKEAYTMSVTTGDLNDHVEVCHV